MLRIAIIPGDGIAIDVTLEAQKVLHTVGRVSGKKIETLEFDYGASSVKT